MSKENSNKENYWPQIVTVLSVSICTFSIGLNLGWANPYIPKLLDPVHTPQNFTSNEVSYIAIISPLGHLVGAPLSSYLAYAIGRKYALLSIAVPQLIGWIILGLSETVVMFCIGRVVAGVAEISVYLLVPMYIGEICHPNIRGILTTSISLSVGIGSVCMSVLGTFTSVSLGSFICAAVPIAFVLTFMWMPESPYYYIIKKNPKRAEESLKTLKKRNDVSAELAQITSDVKRQLSESGTFKDIFLIESNLLAFMIIILMRFFQHYTGIMAFLMYGRKMFQDVDTIPDADTASIINAIFTLISLAFGSFLIDKFGRRIILLISSAGSTLILAIMAGYYYVEKYNEVYISWAPIAIGLLYIAIQSIGLGVTPNVLVGEMLSVSIKSKALFLINIMNGITLSSSTKVFQLLSDEYGYYSPILLFSICGLLGFIFTYIFVSETKGKTLEEIQMILKESSIKLCCKSDNIDGNVITENTQFVIKDTQNGNKNGTIDL